MTWTDLHSTILSRTFEKVLGQPDAGAVAFVRCLTPDVVEALAANKQFAPKGWHTWRVAGEQAAATRTITADRAVELRESKDDAVLLLVDTALAGAGMAGIYSAAREIDEVSLFAEALRLAAKEITTRLKRSTREYAERAVKKARGFGQLHSVSPWTEFDFYVRVAASLHHPGELVWLLGLWPVRPADDADADDGDGLDLSRLFIDRLLGTAFAGQTPAQRVDSLRLLNPSEEQKVELERFLRSAATRPLLTSLEELAEKPNLWVNALKLEGAAQAIQGIELVPWQTRQGKLAKWSGLTDEGEDEPPVLVLDPKADANGNYSHLEVRWRTRPDNLERDAVQYQVSIVSDMDEELASREVPHTAKKEEKCRFTNDDFSLLSEDALLSAKVVLSVIGNESVEPQESEEFIIRFGAPPERGTSGVGKIVRTLSEGLIELDDREIVTALASMTDALPRDSKGYVVLRTPQRGKSFRVFRPPLVHEVEQDWAARAGEIGRWRVKVRASGARAGLPEFVPIAAPSGTSWQSLWDRAVSASRRMAERVGACGGGVGQVYDQDAKVFDTIFKEYLIAWEKLLDEADPHCALANTVEVQSLSGRTIGLIVLPTYPLRVAWHMAYDNLVLDTRFKQNMTPRQVRDELALLDGAMFPAFLPAVESGKVFVFADTLGFHTVGMVQDDDREPKAAIAVLAKALGESESADTAPTVGRQSAHVLGNEILKYLECHDTSRLLHIHALRPGDGLTVARSLGHVHKRSRRAPDDEQLDGEPQPTAPSFVLELYPSEGQRGVAGRFIAEAREKRRSGAGVLLEEDQWMLESTSLPGGMSLPRLRWARKREVDPKTAAHLAVAFDTFESRVLPERPDEGARRRPYFAFGLMSFFERDYRSVPSPLWRSAILCATDGEKHPADRTHTERLGRLQQSIWSCVARSLNAERGVPVLRTEISPEKARSLRELHRLCDWVITLDRNAGIEYFDSPRDNREVYDAYVIDCVPEREDLGCLQLITSTSNLDEIRNLLDGALDLMGLSRSRRNAEFLMEHLKALSGRLAIRLTGQKAPTAELIALAMCQANCFRAPEDDECWTPLRAGFFMPIDDIRDLLPPVADEPEAGVADGGQPDLDADTKATRPDLIYVSLAPRRGLLFRFAEVKYRRHLRTARSPEALQRVRQQLEWLRRRWDQWYDVDGVCASFRALRRAKLARVLRFYADKARRHADDDKGGGLPREAYGALVAEIDRMIEKGGDYTFATVECPDRGWVFCPEFAGSKPLDITPAGWDTRIFLFGANSNFRRDSVGEPPAGAEPNPPIPVSPSGNGPAPTDSSKSPRQGQTSGQVGEAEGDTRSGGTASGAPGTDNAETAPSIRLGTNLLSGADVWWTLTTKGNPHLLVAGLPGMGKTTCLLNLCRQMLGAGVRPIVFSYHQDIDEKLQKMVESVRFIDFHGLGFNPLQVIDRSSRMAYLDVAGAVRDIFVAIFPELGDIQGERIRKAIKDSFIEHGWDDAHAELARLAEPPFSRFVEILRSDPKPDRGLKTLLSRLEELEDYGFFQSEGGHESLWECDQPVVLRIHSTQNDNLQKAFASLVFYGLYKDMFRRGIQNRITHSLIFDEAHRAARLQLIPTMAKECRKYGISLVLASQEARDFNISLFSAVANYLVLRVNEVDAKVLSRNVTTSDQERGLIDRIKQIDRFRAYYCCEGTKKPVPVALQP